MAKTQYLEYTVHLTDEALVNSLNAANPGGAIRAPYNPGPPEGGMAVEAAVDAGTYPPAFPILEQGDAFVAPSLTSPWFDASNTFPRDVATFTRSSGWWIFGGSTKFFWVAKFAYSHTSDVEIPDAPGTATTPDVVERAVMPTRLHLDGMELSGNGEGGSTGTNDDVKGPAGAPLYEGVGFALRQRSTDVGQRGYQYPSSPGTTKVWSRFYFKCRHLPTAAPLGLYRMDCAANAGSGIRVYITPSGQYAFYTATSAGETFYGTAGTVPLDARIRIDVFGYIGTDHAAPTAAPIVKMYFCVNGELLQTAQTSIGALVSNAKYAQVELGHGYNVNAGGEVDFDDWRDAALPVDKDIDAFTFNAYNSAATYSLGDRVYWSGAMPTTAAEIAATNFQKPVLGVECFEAIAAVPINTPPRLSASPHRMDTTHWKKITDSADFVNGTRIVRAQAKSAVEIANFSPADVRAIAQVWVNTNTTNQGVTSATSTADLQLLTDAKTRLQDLPGCLGYCAFVVGLRSTRGSTLSGKIGYKIGANPAFATAITESGSLGFNSTLYAPVGLTAPAAIEDIEVHYQKAADTGTARVTMLAAAVEVAGIFDSADRPKAWDAASASWVAQGSAPASQPHGLHNAPWHNTPWFRASLPPLGPVMIKSGTYVGATGGVTLTFKQPPAFLWIRPTGVATAGAKWFSAGAALGAINGVDQGLGYTLIPRVEKDLAFVPASEDDDQQMQFLVHIGGVHASINTNGSTYQYVAFCDPAARFCLTGAERVTDNLLPISKSLERSNFLPEFGFFHRGTVSTTATAQFWAKGTGHAAAGATDLNTVAETANAITFGTGTLTFGSGFVTATVFDQQSYCLFRREDGNNDPNAPKLMAMGSYIGDGTASRSIATGFITGKRPLWGIVIPHNAAQAHYRDPSHTGTTSQQVTGASQASTGITAGAVDGFSVGSTLNANGVTYSWFLIMGSDTGGNNGWSVNGEFTPVDSDSPVDDTFDTPPDEDDDSGGDSGGSGTNLAEEPDLDGETALPGTDLFCVDFSQKAANIALSRLGVSKVIADLATDATQEAVLARLHIKADVEYVLSRFPWEFARKIAALTLVDGTMSDPVNDDWTFAYRQPTDCIFERRIVVARGQGVNPTPPPFALGRDSDGGVIYTNQENAVLEYTARGLCPAYEGDRLFKEALAWKLGASLAPALTRIADKVTHCLDQVEATIAKAYDVQRPGNPGPASTDTATIDTTAGAVAANLAVVNSALVRIGARTIDSLVAGQSREAIAARLVFEDELKATLRDHPWQFATRYAELVLEDGTASDPVNADWTYSFRMPDDAVRARRIVNPVAKRAQDDADPIPWALATDTEGELLLTDEEAPTLEYTARIDGTVYRADALFKDAFAWRLGAVLALSIAGVDPEEVEQAGRGPDALALEGKRANVKANKLTSRQQIARFAWAKYADVLEQAKRADSNEAQPEPPEEAPWITGRD